MIYVQNYNPLGNVFLSTLMAALPVLVLFFLLVVRRASPPYAAAGGAATALLIATLVYRMPAVMAGMAFLNGAMFGLLPICWVIINAMFLYNITVVTGRFEGIKNSVAGLSADHRLQAVLIAFAFGAFLEGAAGGESGRGCGELAGDPHELQVPDRGVRATTPASGVLISGARARRALRA